MDKPPPPEAIARLRAAVPAFDGLIGVAVSGGPDSLALLILAAAVWPERVVAATVDHRLRPESADEARHVAGICARLGVAHEILVPETPITGSLQAAARAARYKLLEDWRARHDAAWVMTAHHADDQAETLLMRLNRGAGLSGLAGIRAANGYVLRPLLGWRRAELAAMVEAAGIAAIADPSNTDPRFDRVRVRQSIAGQAWLDPAALAASASHLADAEAALDWMVRRIADERVVVEADTLSVDPRGLPAELCRRLVVMILKRLDPEAAPSGPALDRLIAALESGGQASLGGVLCRGGPAWRFTSAPPRRTRG